jgi:hypothetical protein
MFYAISWFVVLALVALWSLAAWALHAVGVWTLTNAGALSGAASGAGATAVAHPDALTAPRWPQADRASMLPSSEPYSIRAIGRPAHLNGTT